MLSGLIDTVILAPTSALLPKIPHPPPVTDYLEAPVSSARLEIYLHYNLPLPEEDPVFISCSTLRSGEFAIILTAPNCYNIVTRMPANAPQYAKALCQNKKSPLSTQNLPLALNDLIQAGLICRHDLYLETHQLDNKNLSLLDLSWVLLPEHYPGFDKYQQLRKSEFTVVQVMTGDQFEIVIHMPDKCPEGAGKVCKNHQPLSASLAGQYVKLLTAKNCVYRVDA